MQTDMVAVSSSPTTGFDIDEKVYQNSQTVGV